MRSGKLTLQAVDDRTKIVPRLPASRIWSMCCGLLGVQFVWALQNGSTSRIFQTLGANVDDLPMLWIAAPVTGLLVQPVIGHLSDRTWGPLGRRRPWILSGAVLTAAALAAMPNATTLAAASLALWLLTASVNVAAEPFRALIADTLPPCQRTTGYAVQVVFIGVGAVLASAMPWLLTHWLGISGRAPPGALPPSIHLSFYIGAAVLLATIGWTVARTAERSPADLAGLGELDVDGPGALALGILRRSAVWWTLGGAALGVIAAIGGLRRETYVLAAIALAFGLLQLAAVRARGAGRRPRGLAGIAEDILEMPAVLKRLAVVQFFTWFALFALWVYAVPVVAARHYGTTDPASAAFASSADWVGVLFAEYNGVAALTALLLPVVVRRFGRRTTHAACLLGGAAGLAGLVAVGDPALLWVPMIGVGCAWASILSLPYAMLADAAPPEKMGVYMGVHNVFLVLPQLAGAALLGPFAAMLRGEVAHVLTLAAASMAAGAVLSVMLLSNHPSANLHV